MYRRFMKRLWAAAEQFPDRRKGGNHQLYTMADACLSAFGVFFTQSPSFLAYQREMQVREGHDNAQSLFGVREIPSDNEIRNLLDPVAPGYVSGVYWETLAELQAQGLLADHHGYRLLPCRQLSCPHLPDICSAPMTIALFTFYLRTAGVSHTSLTF